MSSSPGVMSEKSISRSARSAEARTSPWPGTVPAPGAVHLQYRAPLPPVAAIMFCVAHDYLQTGEANLRHLTVLCFGKVFPPTRPRAVGGQQDLPGDDLLGRRSPSTPHTNKRSVPTRNDGERPSEESSKWPGAAVTPSRYPTIAKAQG